jgi:6-phosphogluconolactonase (cycloisomerase 2 family)
MISRFPLFRTGLFLVALIALFAPANQMLAQQSAPKLVGVLNVADYLSYTGFQLNNSLSSACNESSFSGTASFKLVTKTEVNGTVSASVDYVTNGLANGVPMTAYSTGSLDIYALAPPNTAIALAGARTGAAIVTSRGATVSASAPNGQNTASLPGGGALVRIDQDLFPNGSGNFITGAASATCPGYSYVTSIDLSTYLVVDNNCPGETCGTAEAVNSVSVTSSQVTFAYTANNGDGTVSAFAVNSATGSMTPIGTYSTGGSGPNGAAVDPSGRFLYVSNHGSSSIAIFAIDPSSGSLTPTADSPMPSPAGPVTLAFDAPGNFLYVCNEGFADPAAASVSAFQVDQASGALTPVPGSPFPTGWGPQWVALHPSGQYLYTANSYGNTMNIFGVNSSTGVLTPIAMVPTTGNRPREIAPDPSGAYVYVADESSGDISAYSVDTNTGMLNPLPGFPVALGGATVGVIFDRTGEYLYASDEGGGAILGFSVASAGVLAPLPGSPFSLAPATPQFGAVDPANKFLFMGTLYGTNAALGLAIDTADGSLTPVPGSPFPTGATPQSIALANYPPAAVGSQTITVAGVPSTAVFSSRFTISATSTSGLPVTVTASGVCSLSGATVTMTAGTGTCTLTASQAGNASYAPAPNVVNTLTAQLATPTITFTGVPPTAIFGSQFTISATTNSSTTATITATGVCSITGVTLTLTSGTGTCSLSATWAADSNYASATATQSSTAQKLTPSISWPAPTAVAFGTALSATQLNATANTGGSFAYAPPIGTLLNVGTQTLSVTFTPSDAVDYAAATASVSLSVVNSGVVVVTLRDSAGNPLPGGTVQYYSGTWKPFGTTDATGRTSMSLPAGTYWFSMNYAGAAIQVSQNVGSNPLVSFQTTKATLLLENSSGNPLDTGTVKYYATTWQTFGSGSTSGGQVTMELLPTSYTFAMTYAGAQIEKAQNISSMSTITFQTTKATVLLENSSGNPVDTGTVKYYASTWQTFGSGCTSGGQVTMELLPASYTFAMTYAGAQIEKTQNISSMSTITFQTTKATMLLVNSSGNPLDTGTVQYYATTWQTFGSGSTSGGQVTMELLPASYTFAMTYAGGRTQLTENISTATTVVFQTGSVHSLTCVSYYAGSWLPFTDMMQILPGTYTFRFGDGFPDTPYTIQAGTVDTIH